MINELQIWFMSQLATLPRQPGGQIQYRSCAAVPWTSLLILREAIVD